MATLAVAVAAAAVAASHPFAYKMISGEPSEFNAHELPAPDSIGVHGTHTTFLAKLGSPSAADGTSSWTHTIDVDSPTEFTLGWFTDLKGASVTLVDPSGHAVDLDAHAKPARMPVSDGESDDPNGVEWEFDSPVTVGQYKITVTSASTHVEQQRRRRSSNADYDGILFLWNEAPSTDLMTHVLSLNTVLGTQIGLSARVFDSVAHPWATYLTTKAKPPARLADDEGITSAVVIARSPSNKVTQVPMHDDGVGADDEPLDGDFSGSLEANEAGQWRLQALVTGHTAQGVEYTRSQEHIVVVEDQHVLLRTKAAAAVIDQKNSRLSVFVHAVPTSAESTLLTYKPYMEVWGRNAAGDAVPVAFSENLCKLESVAGVHYLRMELDLRWLAKAGVRASNGLEARNFNVQNADDQVVLAMGIRMPIVVVGKPGDVVAADGDAAAAVASSSPAAVVEVDAAMSALVAGGYRGDVTRVMREGVPPPRRNTTAPLVDGKVLLVHGFCADKNPYEQQPDDWTDAVFYDGVREGHARARSNNQFAEDVLEFVAKSNLGTFSMVGQSQGGMVVLHILNYFHTGVDDVTSGRRIQSLATPYRGTSSIEKVGGVAEILFPDCAPPTDLGRTGAEVWLSGIAQANVDQINAYRTQYDRENVLLSGWCQLLMNSIIETPNDGVVEVAYSDPLRGGNIFPVTKGQCHKEGMNKKWNPSFWDSSRNKEMSAAAGRS